MVKARRARLSSLAAALCALASVFGSVPVAQAEPPAAAPSGDRVLAYRLAKRARNLMKEGRAAEACPLYRESNELDPRSSTLFELALCDEARGKLELSEQELKDVIVAFQAEGLVDREDEAREHLEAIQARRAPENAGARPAAARVPEPDFRSPPMLGVGVALSVTGFITALSSPYFFAILDRDNLTEGEEERALITGGAMLGGGVAAMAIGVPLAVVGGERVAPAAIARISPLGFSFETSF